jgi:hypothetical protein
MWIDKDVRYCGIVLLFFLVGAAVWYGLVELQAGAPTDTSKGVDVVRQLKMKAAESAPRPKLVLVGASGTFYGIKAETIRRELRVPTVNLGLTAGFGPHYIIENAKRVLEPGDTALLTLEYVVLFHRPDLAPYALDYVYSRDPGYISTLPPAERLILPLQMSPFRLAYGLLNRVHPLEMSHPDLPKLAKPLGDGVLPPEVTKDGEERLATLFPFSAAGPDPEKLRKVSEFAAWCKVRGVRLMLSYPAFGRRSDLESPGGKAFLAKLEAFYRSTGAIVVGRPTDYMYDMSWFYDSRMHPKPEYAERYTMQRVRELRPYF